MKKFVYFLLCIQLFTCQDVIEVDLNTTAPRLVVDASINWFKGTSGNQQSIKLSLTAPFFNNGVPPANGATVTVTNEDTGDVFDFLEDGTTGIYLNNTFIPIIGNTYRLDITYNGENYTAQETMQPVVPLNPDIEQNNNGGFTGEEIELKAFFTDPADQKNFYFIEITSPVSVAPELQVIEDRFTNGNQMFGFYSEDNLEAGQEVTFRNFGVSERFYNFLFILLQQGENNGGGQFQTQPATVKGNCINTTNPSNFPFGYFRLSEADEVSYIIQ